MTADVDLKALGAQLDKSDMLGKVTRFPEQMAEAWKIGRDFAATLQPGDYRHVVVLGMGGSAIGGDMLRSSLGDRLRVPVYSCRDYTVPPYLVDGALVIVSSYSGDTGETLSAYDSVRESSAAAIAISSGGKLEKICERDGVPFCRIPGGMPPRSAIAYSYFPALQVLRATQLADIDETEFDEACQTLEDRCREYAIDNPNNPAIKLAKILHGRFPIVYSGSGLFEAVARRWACQFNENSKTLAHFAIFTELSHNEINGWEALPELMKNAVVLSLEDVDDHKMTRAQTKICLDIVAPLAAGIEHFDGGHGGRLSRALSMMILGDFASVYLGYLNGVDPSPVEKIVYLKQQLAQLD